MCAKHKLSHRIHKVVNMSLGYQYLSTDEYKNKFIQRSDNWKQHPKTGKQHTEQILLTCES